MSYFLECWKMDNEICWQLSGSSSKCGHSYVSEVISKTYTLRSEKHRIYVQSLKITPPTKMGWFPKGVDCIMRNTEAMWLFENHFTHKGEVSPKRAPHIVRNTKAYVHSLKFIPNACVLTCIIAAAAHRRRRCAWTAFVRESLLLTTHSAIKLIWVMVFP